MAVARLSRVRITINPPDLGPTVARLVHFGRFHPSHREGLVQDISILLLGSRAQSVYGWATELLARPVFDAVEDRPTPPTSYPGNDVTALLARLEEDLTVLDRNLPLLQSSDDIATVAALLRTVRDASLTLFRSLDRLRVVPRSDGRLTLEGYVPSPSVDALREALGPALDGVEPVLTRSTEDPYLPTLLVNPRVISLFERFTTQRGIPRYSEIDPTPLVALIFPIFFGIMFADLGHGLTLLVFGVYLARATKWAYWGQLLVVFGASASIIGLARGVFFGVTFATPLSAFFAIHPAFNATFTLAYIPFLVEVAVLIGTFHLGSAYVLAILNQVRSGRRTEALVIGVPTLLLYSSLVAFGLAVLGTGLRPWTVFASSAPTPFFREFLSVAVPVNLVAEVSTPLVLGALAVLVVGPAIERRLRVGRWQALGSSLVRGLLDALSRPVEFGMNTLSYIRLAALLVTNTLLSSLIVGVLVLGAVGVALAALLNVALMAMEGLIVYLQDMRLHLFEWMSKFYSGTGTAFDPLTYGGARFRFVWE